MRVGWIAPGRYRDKVTHIKYVSSSMCPTLPQIAIADFIRKGAYARHLRRMRLLYKQGRDQIMAAMNKYLPAQIRCSFPKGGYIMWVELPKVVDVVKLASECREGGVNIAPGTLFSASGKFRNCMRINFSEQDANAREDGIRKLAYFINRQLDV